MFSKHTEVVFGDVNLQENQVQKVHGESQSPGAGGWPTIRYFNKETGYGGKAYSKRTDKAMCEELGDNKAMLAYVETAAGISICRPETKLGCDENQLNYLEKMKDVPLEKRKQDREKLEKLMETYKDKPGRESRVRGRIEILKHLEL
mmetsp:Transcript_25825/g.56989  ORF Transcript_25825/g.56989 Transcript_25825/m.56989 type:complete len:147 (-) Transcript_25825:88-528(-)